MELPEPSEQNAFLREHAVVLAASLRRWTGHELLPGVPEPEFGRALFHAPFAVVSHGTEPDPIFNYANRTALRLFEMTWEQLTALPSRLSAEPVHRDERARLMARVTARGYIDDYQGARVSSTGRRFRIEAATVWNLVDDSGAYRGQAAIFSRWTAL